MRTKCMKNRIPQQLAAAMIALGFQPAIAAAQTAVELEVDLLEVHVGRGDDHLVLDSTLTLGEGADQLLVKAAGGSDTRTAFDDFEVQALYSRSFSDKAALHLGVRHDMRAGSDLTHGVAGMVVGVLPGLEAEHYLFVSQDGDLTGAGQLLLGIDLTLRLVIEPRLAVGWWRRRFPAKTSATVSPMWRLRSDCAILWARISTCTPVSSTSDCLDPLARLLLRRAIHGG